MPNFALKNFPFQLTTLCIGIFSSLVYAGDAEFNVEFLKDVTDQVSVDAVKYGYSIAPGIYDFSIFINEKKIDKRSVRFYNNEKNDVIPCIDKSFLDDYSILVKSSAETRQFGNGCYDITAIPNATITTDTNAQKINLSIPQINLRQYARGYVPVRLFNQGINAIVLNYSATSNYFNNKNSEDRYSNSIFLNGGFNYGAWRYRNQSSLIQYSGESKHWQTISNKLERDLHTTIPMRLELGDSSSNNDVFDSVNFRGIQLSNDTIQLPIGLQNYAPIIRGVAQTNALIEIRQNGYIIYTTNVAAGSFVIDDLYAANESGDLEVSIIESDGHIRKFIQPYSAVPNMVRAGQSKFQVTAGQYRNGTYDNYHPYFTQLSYAYGLNNYFTPYTGAIVAEDYYAVAAGMGLSLGNYGALSSDITYAQNKTAQGDIKTGTSLRFLYAKSLNKLGTNVRLVGYRYSTENYYSLSDAIQEKAQWRNGVYEYIYNDNTTINNNQLNEDERKRYYYSTTYYNKRNQFQVSLNQNLGKWGQIYATLAKTDFWQKEYNQESWQIGYNHNYKNISYGLYYQRNKSMYQSSTSNVGFNISLPLDRPRSLKKYDLVSYSSFDHSNDIGNTTNSSLSGSFLEDKNLTAQLQVGHTEQNSNDTLAISTNYRGTQLNSSFGYTYSDQYQQASANINGGVLIHSDGILFGQQMYSNPIIVEAKGAEGVRVENQSGLKIDKSGYAVISGSSAYMRNRVALRAEDIGQNINIEDPVVNDIVPTKYAIVKVKFDVRSGKSVLATLRLNNKFITTGASVVDMKTQKNVGLVGLNGEAYLSGVQSEQKLLVKWGDDAIEQCQLVLPLLSERKMGYDEINVECTTVGEP
ncbi:fimbria/pilus outer membrane usher protein [Acinetobacter baumannii]|uniref:fimbria/pilus outer membrane usher protein n=1 Tax=Acinetobacter calcoaceticus/baumannii complex TaxID=909768 RepID=UPI0024B79A82|nr:fimbria/pilus outer membrane usher protein [Acinetobacter baumannii]MDI9705334.1 fimbria/pilus outer membrane usher protein [Acinetobacter baumannii]MDI9807659.1 fimbria/pilus outer membrane usher protein [Acinetobacter baumannii]